MCNQMGSSRMSEKGPMQSRSCHLRKGQLVVSVFPLTLIQSCHQTPRMQTCYCILGSERAVESGVRHSDLPSWLYTVKDVDTQVEPDYVPLRPMRIHLDAPCLLDYCWQESWKKERQKSAGLLRFARWAPKTLVTVTIQIQNQAGTVIQSIQIAWPGLCCESKRCAIEVSAMSLTRTIPTCFLVGTYRIYWSLRSFHRSSFQKK